MNKGRTRKRSPCSTRSSPSRTPASKRHASVSSNRKSKTESPSPFSSHETFHSLSRLFRHRSERRGSRRHRHSRHRRLRAVGGFFHPRRSFDKPLRQRTGGEESDPHELGPA